MTMDEKKIHLDDAAEQLFAQIEGIEAHKKGHSAADMMAESLAEEQKQQDVWRILLCEIVHHIAGFFQRTDPIAPATDAHQTFDQLSDTLAKLSQFPRHAGRILVRYRGHSGVRDIPDRLDYEILFGNMVVDLEMIPTMIKRHGHLLSHLMGQLLDAFERFSKCGINNLHLNLPKSDPDSQNRLRRSLYILSRFYRAGKHQQTISLGSGKKDAVPLVTDEMGCVSANLTLLAGVNGLGAQTMRNLVTKVDAWIRKKEKSEAGCQFTSVYNAIFGLPKISAQLIAPPIEINNLDWLMREESEKSFSREKAKVARIIASSEVSPEKTAKVIKSVYGDDYQKIKTRDKRCCPTCKNAWTPSRTMCSTTCIPMVRRPTRQDHAASF